MAASTSMVRQVRLQPSRLNAHYLFCARSHRGRAAGLLDIGSRNGSLCVSRANLFFPLFAELYSLHVVHRFYSHPWLELPRHQVEPIALAVISLLWIIGCGHSSVRSFFLIPTYTLTNARIDSSLPGATCRGAISTLPAASYPQ